MNFRYDYMYALQIKGRHRWKFWIAILISDKVVFRARIITSDKVGLLHNDKRVTSQKDSTITNNKCVCT